MLTKTEVPADEDNVVEITYLVADAIDLIDGVHSAFMQRKLEAAKVLLQATYKSLVSSALDFDVYKAPLR